jgi:hypothetical protein
MKINKYFLLIFVIFCLQSGLYSQTSFNHRGYLGWLIDLSRNDCHEEWPSIKIDSSLVTDYIETLDFLQRSNMTEMSLWGFFTNKYWEPQVENTIDTERKVLINKLLANAHSRKIKVLCGLGIYSWGFNKIIKEYPSVGCPCNKQVMDLTNDESWNWQKKVIDFIMDNFDFDGFSLQSADLGRCNCGNSANFSTMEYHAILNQKAVSYIRSKKPDLIIGISGWGMDFSNPNDLKYIKEMTRNVNYLIDIGESAGFAGKETRKQLINAILPCEYGNSAIPNIEPIQALPRYYYFVPTVYRTGQRLKELYNDGGRACEAYVRTRGNPGDEITIEVVAKLLSNPENDITTILEESLQDLFHPENELILKELVNIYHEAEDAFFNYCYAENQHSQYKDIILLMPRDLVNPESTYLKNMTIDNLRAYESIMKNIETRILIISDHVNNQDKIKQLSKCITTVIGEINRLKK